ncbi:DUF4153 domain-containing protein [Streptomyces sp. CAU 1734]|uniref:DUF4153 domain-containing protein n=1 Tax=Streptomyces sp. CAU 1734 TaxID=3140360 RepID=UPI00326066AE
MSGNQPAETGPEDTTPESATPAATRGEATGPGAVPGEASAPEAVEGRSPAPGPAPAKAAGPGPVRSRAAAEGSTAGRWRKGEQEPWAMRVRPRPPAAVRPATLWSALATGLLSAALLGDGAGPNLLIVAVSAALAASFAARTAGRLPRPWTWVWAAGGLVLLVVPALRDSNWPSSLAVVAAFGAGALALHGGRTWPGLLLGPLGIPAAVVPAIGWARQGVAERVGRSRGRWGPVLRTTGIAAGLLLVFGALFASADAAFADLLGGLIPDVPVADGPWRFLLFLLGLTGALAAARAAAAPLRWDRLAFRAGKARPRWEWALPLIVLDLLVAAFIAVQLAVLFGGYDKVLEETGLTYAQYARQGFWQLLWATLLTLVVIALALRWAPRSGPRDRALVRGVLGTLCLLTLVVVASALRRMDLYVDAYGLTRLRVSVAAMELWLGLVIVLIMAAGVFGAAWLPRAVGASAVAAVLAFGLMSPDGVVAERNVARYERTGKIDVDYFPALSADAVPALDGLPEPLRSCALERLARNLEADRGKPWYATSWSEHRARRIIAERPVDATGSQCGEYGRMRGEGDEYDGGATPGR